MQAIKFTATTESGQAVRSQARLDSTTGRPSLRVRMRLLFCLAGRALSLGLLALAACVLPGCGWPNPSEDSDAATPAGAVSEDPMIELWRGLLPKKQAELATALQAAERAKTQLDALAAALGRGDARLTSEDPRWQDAQAAVQRLREAHSELASSIKSMVEGHEAVLAMRNELARIMPGQVKAVPKREAEVDSLARKARASLEAATPVLSNLTVQVRIVSPQLARPVAQARIPARPAPAWPGYQMPSQPALGYGTTGSDNSWREGRDYELRQVAADYDLKIATAWDGETRARLLESKAAGMQAIAEKWERRAP